MAKTKIFKKEELPQLFYFIVEVIISKKNGKDQDF